MRETGVIRAQAALIVIGINEDGRREGPIKVCTQYVITEEREAPGARGIVADQMIELTGVHAAARIPCAVSNPSVPTPARPQFFSPIP